MSNELHLVDARQRYVRKSNAIIQRSRFSLSMQQQKVLLYLISKIDARDEDFKEYDLDIIEYCRLAGIDYKSGNYYNDIKTNIKAIADKSMWITLEDGSSSLVRWIEKAKIEENSGIVKIRLDNDMKPFLLKLKGNFTSYQIIFILAFHSKYSIRAYELFCSLQYDKCKPYVVTYTVEELKERLGAETHKLYKNFKSNVLLRIIRDINEYSDKAVEYKEIKRGKKVIAIEFTIDTKSRLDQMKTIDRIDSELGTNQLSLY